MARRELDFGLNQQQEEEAQRIYERLKGAFDDELRSMARFMASKADNELFGRTEFELRDKVHQLGAQVLEAAAEERQKKGVPRC